MFKLMKDWQQLAKETNNTKYDQLVRNVWQNFGVCVSKQIEDLSDAQGDITKCIDGHVLLLVTLKNPVVVTQKNITFEDEVNLDSEIIEASDDSIENVTNSDEYNHNLLKIVELICVKYIEYGQNKDLITTVLIHLMPLLKVYDSGQFFKAVAGQFKCSGLVEFYESVLRKWLTDDVRQSKVVLEMVFMMVRHMEEVEQDVLFNSFDKVVF